MIQVLLIGVILLAGILGERWLFRDWWAQDLSVRLEFEQKGIYEGEQGTLAEQIENRKRLPLPMLKCKFQTDRNLDFGQEMGSRTTDKFYRNDVFQISAGERVTRRLKFTGRQRGFYEITQMDLVSNDFLLLDQFVSSKPVETGIFVYPAPIFTDEFQEALVQMDFLRTSTRRTLEEPFSFRGIRDYQTFDEMRSINWKASAKTGDLLVNMRDYTTSRPVILWLNLEDNGIMKREDGVEGCFRIASGILHNYLHLGVPVAIYGNCMDRYNHAPLQVRGRSEMDLSICLQAMSRSDEKNIRPFADFWNPDRNEEQAMVCFITPNLYPEFLELVESYSHKRDDYYVLYSNEQRKTPEIPAFLNGHFSDIRVVDLKQNRYRT